MKKLILTLIVAFATVCGFAQESISVEYPYYETINTRIFDISKVVADKEATVLEVYFYAVENITFDANTMLVGDTTGKHYKLLRSKGVEIGHVTNLPECGFMKGVLIFEPLEKEDRSFDFDGGKSGIDFIEAASACFVREQVSAHSLARNFHSSSRSVLHVKQYSIKPN